MEKFPNFGPAYEILEELGRGTTGIVFKARNKKYDRLLAVKTIFPKPGDAGIIQIERFHREIMHLARCDHPNIALAFDADEIEGQVFYAREFVEGETLSSLVRKDSFPDREASRIVEAVASAIHDIHSKGLIHRNLTLENVLLTTDGPPKLIGFGKAKFLLPEETTSDNYSTDIQALGKILCSLLAEKPLLPGFLARICGKSCNIDPENQYHSAMELAEDLRRYLLRA